MKTGAFDSVSIREFEIRDKEETTPEKPQDPEEKRGSEKKRQQQILQKIIV